MPTWRMTATTAAAVNANVENGDETAAAAVEGYTGGEITGAGGLCAKVRLLSVYYIHRY